MALNQTQQFNELINSANSFLICLPKNLSIDAIGSALALAEYLKKSNKKITIAGDNFEVPKNLNFLEGVDKIEKTLLNLRQFVINVDLAGKKVDEFSYDVVGENLKIFVLPKQGEIEEKDVNFSSSDYRFDCVICLDTPDLEENIF